MARTGKYQEWLQPDKLEQITNWAAKGLNNKELAQSMNVVMSTFCLWRDKYPEISEAIKKGRQLSVQCIENKFFQTAFGGVEEITEVIEEKTVIDNKGVEHKIVDKKITKRKLPPNVTAQIFYLKNKAGYRDNPEESQEVEDTEAFFSEAGFLS